LSINLSVDLELPIHKLTHDATHDVTCDFVDSWAFGTALGVGVRSVGDWWTVEEASLSVPIEVKTSFDFVEMATNKLGQGLSVDLVKPTRVAPKQTRILPLKITQTSPFNLTEIGVTLSLRSSELKTTMDVVLAVRQLGALHASDHSQIKASYFYAETSPTAFYAIPPLQQNEGQPRPPIIALRMIIYLALIQETNETVIAQMALGLTFTPCRSGQIRSNHRSIVGPSSLLDGHHG
jgi:hypothetical protein